MESLEFDFSPEWNDLCRTVTFFPPKSVAKCVSFTGNTIPLPPEVTARAGRTPYVLCGAKDGAAIITLTGAITVSETLLPTESQTEEYTPGALETATLLCEEARVDAQSAAVSAESVRSAEARVLSLAEEITEAGKAVTDLYDEMMDGITVHAKITEANSLDDAHPVSVAGLCQRINELLGVVCPFKIKIVDTLPDDPDINCIYLYDGNAMVYSTDKSTVKLSVWAPTYLTGAGPARIYTIDGVPGAGTVLYWCGTAYITSMDDMIFLDSIKHVSGGVYTTSNFGDIQLEYTGVETVAAGSGNDAWQQITNGTDLTYYLRENPAKWLVTGGGA